MTATPQMYQPNLLIRDGILEREQRKGDGFCAYMNPVSDATAGAYTIPVEAIARGGYVRDGGAGDRVDTLPTGAVLDTAFPDLGIGESVMFMVSNIGTTNKLTITTAASGTTVSGHTAVLHNTAVFVQMTKTAAATYTFNCL